jgi:hypothetical protein
MKDAKNELMQFVAGIVMLAVGLFIFSQKVIVHSGFFGFGGMMSFGAMRVGSGLIMVPLIIGIIWMFASGASFASKIFTGLSVLLIIVSVIMSTYINLVSMTLFDWILILVLIFGGVGFIAKVLLGNRKDDTKLGGSHKEKSEDAAKSDIDKQIEELKKKM